jgi:hypothetical protein
MPSPPSSIARAAQIGANRAARNLAEKNRQTGNEINYL